jgi:hypothetical protein
MKKIFSSVLATSFALAGCFDDGQFIDEDVVELKTPAGATSVTYSGQGLIADGFGGYDLQTELCGLENGADVDGPYLLWVLTATQSKTAPTITGPWGTATMTASGGGTYKYISAWYAPSTLPGNVTASLDGKSANPQLVISHGCRPLVEGDSWCSPGFWRNARDGAWALTGLTRADVFNAYVPPFYYGATFVEDPSLGLVLDTPQSYSGDPLPGTSGYPLNAFNATGAMLTDRIPGHGFSVAVMQAGGSDACPIDSFGHPKR